MQNFRDKKVIVALSGGVDSAVALALLKEKGYQVEGIFMKNWSGDDFSISSDCPWEQDQNDAEAVCKALNVPFRSVNFEKEYREKVVEYFFREYQANRTPNPDVMCNKEIKFDAFLKKAFELGADYIATGHYVRIIHSKKGPILMKGIDTSKDQSYFLNYLDKSQLEKVLFPIGDFTKKEVREMARKFKLPVSEKKDSQGICFIGKIDVQKFLRDRIKQVPGPIVDIDTGKQIGNHDGTMFYTIGQRDGLNLGGFKQPYFVIGKENNTLFVANGKDNPALFSNTVRFSNPNIIYMPAGSVSASIRYRHNPANGKLDLKENTFIFEEPQRAISPGQSIVFYQRDVCLGGAVIEQLI